MKPEDLLKEVLTEAPVVYTESVEDSDGNEFFYLKVTVDTDDSICITQDLEEEESVCLTIEQLESILETAKSYIETK